MRRPNTTSTTRRHVIDGEHQTEPTDLPLTRSRHCSDHVVYQRMRTSDWRQSTPGHVRHPVSKIGRCRRTEGGEHPTASPGGPVTGRNSGSAGSDTAGELSDVGLTGARPCSPPPFATSPGAGAATERGACDELSDNRSVTCPDVTRRHARRAAIVQRHHKDETEHNLVTEDGAAHCSVSRASSSASRASTRLASSAGSSRQRRHLSDVSGFMDAVNTRRPRPFGEGTSAAKSRLGTSHAIVIRPSAGSTTTNNMSRSALGRNVRILKSDPLAFWEF